MGNSIIIFITLASLIIKHPHFWYLSCILTCSSNRFQLSHRKHAPKNWKPHSQTKSIKQINMSFITLTSTLKIFLQVLIQKNKSIHLLCLTRHPSSPIPSLQVTCNRSQKDAYRKGKLYINQYYAMCSPFSAPTIKILKTPQGVRCMWPAPQLSCLVSSCCSRRSRTSSVKLARPKRAS